MKLSSLRQPDYILQDSGTIQCVFQVRTYLYMKKLQSPYMYFSLSFLGLNFHKKQYITDILLYSLSNHEWHAIEFKENQGYVDLVTLTFCKWMTGVWSSYPSLSCWGYGNKTIYMYDGITMLNRQ